MRLNILTILSTVAVASVFGPAFADVTVKDAWVRATPGNSRVTAAYAVLVNSGPSEDVLFAVRTPAAGMAHLHASEGKDGVMRMDTVEMLAVPAKKEVALTPGSYHVMIMGLKAPLKVGEELPLTFSFRHQGDVTVTAKVMPLAYAGAASALSGANDHHK